VRNGDPEEDRFILAYPHGIVNEARRDQIRAAPRSMICRTLKALPGTAYSLFTARMMS